MAAPQRLWCTTDDSCFPKHPAKLSSCGSLQDLTFGSFSGESPPNKEEVSYGQWTFEVCSVIGHYSQAILREGMIKSLRENAVDILCYLGPGAWVQDILDKLDTMCGTVSTFDAFMQGFFSAVQGHSNYLPRGQIEPYLH